MWAIRYEISSTLSYYLFECKAARKRFALQSYRRIWCHTGLLMRDGFMELVPLEKVVVMLVAGVSNTFSHFFDTKDDLESLLWLQFCWWSLLVQFFKFSMSSMICCFILSLFSIFRKDIN